MKHLITRRPPKLRSGDIAFEVPMRMVASRSEFALSIALIANRRLFGMIYARLQGDYFYNMPRNSGLYVKPLIMTKHISPETYRPGDIDILIIPYEEDHLILDRTMAIEIKAVRATFLKQGKSPNDFGISQGQGLLRAGFPYAAVIHLIVSDQSPREAWREAGVARIIGDDGRAEILPDQEIDLLPIDLIHRNFGRLSKLCPDKSLGLAAAYIDMRSSSIWRDSLWTPDATQGNYNILTKESILQNTAAYFDSCSEKFHDIPRFDPF